MNHIARLKNNTWITSPKPNPQADMRLFCFPYAGGSPQIFRTWHEELPENVEVCPVQLPGHGLRMRETPFTKLIPLVQAATRAILPKLDKPFAFFGHSMGAWVSFELTRQLRRRYGLLPMCFFVSSRYAPHRPDPESPRYNLSESELKERLRAYNATPGEVLECDEMMKLMLPIFRADFEVLETYVYVPEPPFDCPIFAFGGMQDHKVSRNDLEAWSEHTNKNFSLHMFSGDHFYLQTSKTPLLHAISKELIAYYNGHLDEEVSNCIGS